MPDAQFPEHYDAKPLGGHLDLVAVHWVRS